MTDWFDQITENLKALNDRDPVDVEASALHRQYRQQQSVLRALLRQGLTPEEIKNRFPTDWSIEDIQALRNALDVEDEA